VLNSRAFFEALSVEIARTRRSGRGFALAYLDVDNFKLVNDTRGHWAGDVLLRLIADSVRQGLRTTDVVARLGGDEFALLLGEATEQTAHMALTRIVAQLRLAARAGGWPISYSIGAVVFAQAPSHPETGSSATLGSVS
jgi:diguanylate cyclase (GGDEF)-like protein